RIAAGALRRLLGLALIPLLAGCSAANPPARSASLPVGGQRALDPHSARFVDVTDQAGIHFRHDNGSFGKKLMPETTGAGCAFLDFDRDGWEDVLFVNSGELVPTGKSAAPKPPTNVALYRNNRDGTFTEEAERAGLVVTEYGMGVCVGDYDNDG